MNELEKNSINLYGNRGRKWLESLPHIINILTHAWHLSDSEPVENMTYHYVAKAMSPLYGPVILKICCDKKCFAEELKALKHFDGHGMVKLRKYTFTYSALLLQQALPGISLHSIYPHDSKHAIRSYAHVVKRLISVPQKNIGNFRHYKEWLKALDHSDSTKMPQKLLKRAINLKNTLLSTSNKEYVLHGDLHLDNIVSHNTTWLAIDPKGIVGDLAFEVANFNVIDTSEFNRTDVSQLFATRVHLLAKHLALDPDRLMHWIFVRLLLSACWKIEDKDSPALLLNQALQLFPHY